MPIDMREILGTETRLNPLVIGITGKAQSGKDTLGRYLLREFFAAGREPVRIGFADALKREVAAACGVSVAFIEANKELFRPVLQWWGMWRRSQNPNYWIERVKDTMSGHICEGANAFVITDVRFRNEADFVREFGGQIISVARPGIETMDHVSETELDREPVEWVVINTSFDALKSAAEDIVYVIA